MPRIAGVTSLLVTGGLLGAAMLSTGCYTRVPAPNLGLDSQPAAITPSDSPETDLAQARRMWADFGARGYTFSISAWGSTGAYSVTIEVADGGVRGLHDFVDDQGRRSPPPSVAWTVDRIFEAIERDGQFRVRYDATIGYPTSFTLGRPGATYKVHWLQKPIPEPRSRQGFICLTGVH